MANFIDKLKKYRSSTSKNKIDETIKQVSGRQPVAKPKPKPKPQGGVGDDAMSRILNKLAADRKTKSVNKPAGKLLSK